MCDATLQTGRKTFMRQFSVSIKIVPQPHKFSYPSYSTFKVKQQIFHTYVHLSGFTERLSHWKIVVGSGINWSKSI